MTREEAEIYARNISYEDALFNLTKARAIPYKKATLIKVYELIQALSQEPCDNTVSRILQRMWNCRGKHTTSIDKVKMEQIIRDELPSVTHKSGKWIDYRDDGFVECPFCGHATNCEDDIDELHYCFYCGAKMDEPQESEE